MMNIGSKIAKCVAVWMFLTAASQAAEPVDSYPPPKIAGKVEGGEASFTYASDVESIPGSLPMINHWVCNNDNKNLIFQWEKARLVRGPLHELEPNDCQDNPHPVTGIEDQPDTDAPILYTQSRQRRDAAIYKEAPAKTEATSILRTTYTNADGQKKELEVQIDYEVRLDLSINLRIFASPADIRVGLGDWQRAASSATFNEQLFLDKAAEKSVDFINNPLVKILDQQDIDWLPASMQDDWLLYIKSGLEGGTVALPVATKYSGNYESFPSTIYAFDNGGRLIATGSYSQIIPK